MARDHEERLEVFLDEMRAGLPFTAEGVTAVDVQVRGSMVVTTFADGHEVSVPVEVILLCEADAPE